MILEITRKKSIAAIITLVVLIAIPVTVYLSNKQQDIRSRASEGSSSSILTPPKQIADFQGFSVQTNGINNLNKEKAPKVLPKKPVVFPEKKAPATISELSSQIRTNRISSTQSEAVASDTTPPVGPTQITAGFLSTLTINAHWDAAQDPESGLSSYVFGIGTVSSGDYSTLANVRWWEVSNDTNISVGLNLDPNQTYYVSVFAVNNQGLSGPIITSAPIHPVYVPLGQASNVMQVNFASTGIDLNGNPTTGWTQDEITTMSAFINKMYSILVDLYGPPADNYTVTIVRDLRYSGTNIFIPSTDEIRKDDSFYPQLLTHELIHAFRNDHILSSDQNWNFDSTLSPFEESFAQAVSYEAMNRYVALYPNDSLVPGDSLWGSSFDWDYDYQNTPELKGTDFWSDGGGTGLYWLKYETGAAAIRKINLESPGFYKRFNQKYYARINANPTTVRVSRALIVDIIKTVIPQIEGIPADDWINKQNIFYAQNVYGEKIWHKVQDYPTNELFAFHSMYFMDTMSCGSEWACWDGQKWVYYRLNGSNGAGSLVDVNGGSVWSGNLQIKPTLNPSDGNFVIGSAVKNVTTAVTLSPWPGGDPNEYIMNVNNFGLYQFNSSFIDSLTGALTSNSIYRVMGSQIAQNYKGIWGGVVGHKRGTIYLNHEGYADEPGIPVSSGAFFGTRSWVGVPNSRTNRNDSVPGKVFVTFTDSDTNETFHMQRNIDYGSVNGNQMFLFDFISSTPPPDSTAPLISVTAPLSNANITGASTKINANASDNIGVTKVKFYVDGVKIATDTTSPYSSSWNTQSASLGSHSLTAKAYDQAGNVKASSAISVTVSDATLPTVSITAPANNRQVNRSSNVTISATAADNRSIKKVEFYVKNVLKCTDTSTPYSCVWAVPNPRGVSYTLKATAYDTSNNKANKTSTVTSR